MPLITVSEASVSDVSADVLVLPLLAGADDAPAVVPGQEQLSAALSDSIAALELPGGRGDLQRLPSAGLTSAGTILLVGLGGPDLSAISAEDVRLAYGAATRSIRSATAAIVLPGGTPEQDAAAVEGAALGAYAYTALKSEPATVVDSVVVLGDAALAPVVERAQILSDVVDLTRDLVNTPPNLLYPAEFARRAQEAAADLPVEVTVLDEKELADGGYGGIVGVGQGSARPPRLVRVAYAPEGATASVGLVGKGITFDTGGISLKPGAGMEDMTSDMTGAATVLSAVLGAARLGLDIKVTAHLAIAENMPGGGAQRPGDVVTMRNGTTVEVLNTDAEGRMVMADALVDAVAEGPDLVLDVATLTGAAMVALGKRTAAVLGTDSAREIVLDAAGRTGELFWPLPLPAELRPDITGRIADLRNIGAGRWGGALTAGLFLREFVGDAEWAHLDIAGPSFADAPLGYMGKGATGMSVRTVLQVLEDRAS
ncbi:leucyl aminopeptidase [Brachybacterium sp. DNPG3]